jgi:hypothetical protein
MPGTTLGDRATSLGLSSPTTHSPSGAHFTRAYHTRYVALSGFHNLLAPFFSGRLPVLFQPVAPMGFSLQSFSPCTQPGHPLGATCPPVVTPLQEPTSGPSAGCRATTSTYSVKNRCKPHCSPGLHPLQGVHPHHAKPFDHPPLSLPWNRSQCVPRRPSESCHVGRLA